MEAQWQIIEVTSPQREQSVRVIAARDIPYISNGNRLQTLSIYLPIDKSTEPWVGKPVQALPSSTSSAEAAALPRYQVHIHGGAWRDPNLLASSIEASVAYAFENVASRSLDAIISLNYTLSPFPTHPTSPYDPIKDNHSDPGREAVHPKHIQDVLYAFDFLRSLGIRDDNYVLSGHSAGACLAFQAALFEAEHWLVKLPTAQEIPRPAALLGMNGLYGLPELVHHLGTSHAALETVYADLLQIAFGEEPGWLEASPAHIPDESIRQRIASSRAPKLVIVDQSTEDQLVHLNQMEMMKWKLSGLEGLQVVQGKRCTGSHASPWEQGYMIWDNIQDILAILSHRS